MTRLQQRLVYIGCTGLLFFVVVLVPVSPASAHGEGKSWEYKAGHYLIDIGYDSDIFVAGNYVRFDFDLKDQKTLEPSAAAQIWVRILKNGEGTLLATGIHDQPVGATTLLYVFPEKGDYTLEASFRDDSGHDIATTSFPISVQEPTAAAPYINIISIALGCVGIVFVGFWLGTIYRSRRD